MRAISSGVGSPPKVTRGREGVAASSKRESWSADRGAPLLWGVGAGAVAGCALSWSSNSDGCTCEGGAGLVNSSVCADGVEAAAAVGGMRCRLPGFAGMPNSANCLGGLLGFAFGVFLLGVVAGAGAGVVAAAGLAVGGVAPVMRLPGFAGMPNSANCLGGLLGLLGFAFGVFAFGVEDPDEEDAESAGGSVL